MAPMPVIQVRTGGSSGAALVFVVFMLLMVGGIFAAVGTTVFSSLRAVNTAVETATQSATQPIAITGNAGAGNLTCQRARRCCAAYAEAMGQAAMQAQICGSVEQAASSPAAETTCTAMASAWRQSLTSMSKAVPADCQ